MSSQKDKVTKLHTLGVDPEPLISVKTEMTGEMIPPNDKIILLRKHKDLICTLMEALAWKYIS